MSTEQLMQTLATAIELLARCQQHLPDWERLGVELERARVVLAAAPGEPALMVDMVPPATARDRWMYEQGRLAERDPRSHPAQQPLTETQLVKCLVAAGCIGTVKMTFDSGPYEITRSSMNADRLCREIERELGIASGGGA